MTQRTCKFEGCDRKRFGHGWCQKHYYRWRTHGDPCVVKKPTCTPRPPIDPWERIDQSAGPDACWPWTRGTDRDGYGVFKLDGRQHRAPRWVLGQKLGRELRPDEVTRHACDNRICCNPEHLIPGSTADNAADAVARGRLLQGANHWAARSPERVSGEANPAARLTEPQVIEIRRRYDAGGVTQKELAEEFGMSQPLIGQIVRRVAWKTVA